MDFNLVDVCGPPPIWEEFLWTVLLLGPVLGTPFVLWLRRSPRNALDVLGSALAPPPSAFQRVLGFSGWLLRAALLLILPLWVAVLIHVQVFFRFEELFWPRGDWSVDPSWVQLAVAVLVCSLGFIHWLRSSPSERDVLRAAART